MTRSLELQLLQEQIELLVRHFGVGSVQNAVKKYSPNGDKDQYKIRRKNVFNRKSTHPTIVQILELIRKDDSEKYNLLSEFLLRLRDREVLPESQDIITSPRS